MEKKTKKTDVVLAKEVQRSQRTTQVLTLSADLIFSDSSHTNTQSVLLYWFAKSRVTNFKTGFNIFLHAFSHLV